jgi:hypothetical protein
MVKSLLPPAMTPFDVPNTFEIKIARTYKEAIRLRNKGYCPVECSFGEGSVVDDLVMDHHGELSHLDSVAIRAYKGHFGARRGNPKFVVTGFSDEDACFAIAALAGALPHHSLVESFPNAPPAMRALARQNIVHVAEIIAKVDSDPNQAITLLDSHWGRVVLAWRIETSPTCRDILQWYGGVARWRDLLTIQSDDFIEAARDTHHDNIAQVLSARSQKCGQNVTVVDFSQFGPNSLYYQKWCEESPVIIAHQAGTNGLGPCSFAVRDVETARSFWGDLGLRAIYPTLNPMGCGGRETLGGSSRSQPVSWAQAIEFGNQISNSITAT